MADDSPSRSRASLITLLMAALAPPTAAGLLAALGHNTTAGLWLSKQILEKPARAIFLALLYYILVFGLGFLAKVWERLQARWVDALADRLDAHVRVLLSNYERRYKKQLVYRHRTFDVKGLTTPGIYDLEIDQVFVELHVAPQIPDKASTDPIPSVLGLASGGPKSVWEYLKAQRLGGGGYNLVIIGAPGSGKTTLMKHVALTLASTRRKLPLRAIPILLFLRDHADTIKAKPDVSLAQVISDSLTKMECPAPVGWLDSRLRDGKLLVMMDGLDEVADKDTRKLVVQWVDGQIETNGNNRFLITSRPFGYRDNPLSSVTVLQVRPFNSDQVNQFVRNWYLANQIRSAGKNDAGVRLAAREGAEDLLRRLQRTPALSDLAVNPLLLTMITTVHRYRSSLPGRRVELYAEICDVFLGKRQQARGMSLDLTPAQKKHIITPLAYDMMCSRRREVSLTDAVRVISDSLQKVSPQTTGEDFLKMIENSSGLLLEREIGVFSFAHLTVQEYLAAVHIAEHKLEDSLIRQLGDSWWHETTRLFCAQADATAIISACLLGGHPSVPLLTLAIECIEEAREVQRSVRLEIQAILAQGVEDSDSARRRATAKALLSLRFRRMVRIDEEVYVDASFMTNAEYQLFLDDYKSTCNYYQPDHWKECQFPPGTGTTPIVGVRASDAVRFCEWLTKQDQEGWIYQLVGKSEHAPDVKVEASCSVGYWYPFDGGVKFSGVSDLKSTITREMLVDRAEAAVKTSSGLVSDQDDELDRALSEASVIRRDDSHVFTSLELSQLANALDRAVARAHSLAVDVAHDFTRERNLTLDRAFELTCDPMRAVNVDCDLALANELPRDIDRALFRSRAQDDAHTRALDFACLLFIVASIRCERLPDAISTVRSSVSKAFFILAVLFLCAGIPEGSREGKKREYMVNACIGLFVDSVILNERGEGRLAALEGIRIVRCRNGPRGS